jgi:hypothetical protein
MEQNQARENPARLAELDTLKDIDLHSFAKAWVAGLVSQSVDAIRPHDPRDRQGFAGVLEMLDKKVASLVEQGAPADAILPLLQVANELRPSNTGSYEGFEAALRALQLTFTSSPNPWYDDIEFPVSQIQANSFMKQIPSAQRQLALEAAMAFITASGRASHDNVSRQAIEA